MCAIFGAAIWYPEFSHLSKANFWLNEICSASMERGRDGRGWIVNSIQSEIGGGSSWVFREPERKTEWRSEPVLFFKRGLDKASCIGNLRAEPTTEYVVDKKPTDQQPYCFGPWAIVHNGTIANDKELRTNELETSIDSAAIVELLAQEEMRNCLPDAVGAYFAKCIAKLKGSYAILATHDDHPDMILAAANYRPIWFSWKPQAVFFASARHYFPSSHVSQMLEPYSVWLFNKDGRFRLDRPKVSNNQKALVICSGGLDSTVAASWAKAEGYQVELLHFRYGSRAEGPEVKAVHDIAEAFDVPLHMMPLPIYKPEDSPLLRADSAIAGGEQGAEFAYEWVPARNLVMLSIATALAEAGGFETLVLGNNLEEAGAYPDNEPEFIARFNDVLPFAVADGKRVRVVMPVGNLMKHEIVALGHKLGAPLDKTWSCYRAGEQHCGTCGPCFMRRTAFEINGLPEVITYEKERTK